MMRRAYNAGRWSAARHHARLLLHRPKEMKLARSVFVRSYWNEGQFEQVLACSSEWDDEISQTYRSLAEERLAPVPTEKRLTRSKKERIEGVRNQQPEPKAPLEWNEQSMPRNFAQEGQRLWFRYPEGYVYWDMPSDYVLDETHPALLCLAAEALLYPWHAGTKAPFPSQRPFGKRCSLAFSAGTDSSAAALVMPEDTLLGYHRRSFASMLDHRNAERLIMHLTQTGEREVIQIPSNHELIRTHHEKPVGFSSDFASAVHLILLADHYDLGAVGFGMPIDNTYLWKGRKYRDFQQTNYFDSWTKRFAEAGLDLLFPIASISEAGALMIVKQSSWLEHLNSCMRGDGKHGCGRCWKCFHKNGPLGRPFDINAHEIQTYLNKRPMPTATHALWALQSMGHEEEVPDLAHLFEVDYAWWAKIYLPGLELLPERWRGPIEGRVRSFLPLMDQPYKLQNVNHFDE
jgi:hypothetical protein